MHLGRFILDIFWEYIGMLVMLEPLGRKNAFYGMSNFGLSGIYMCIQPENQKDFSLITKGTIVANCGFQGAK